MQKIHGAIKAKETIANLIIATDIIVLTKTDCIVSRDEKFIKTTTGIGVITPRKLPEKMAPGDLQ